MTMVHETSTEMRLAAIEAQLSVLVDDVRERGQMRQSLTELTGDLSPVAKQAMGSLTVALEDVQQRGYVEFAKGGLTVVDKVVTSFTKEDLDALGDNVVLILETIKEMTQPEVMQMLQSTLNQASEIDESSDPPGLLSLLNRLRGPAARRGLYRLVFLVESLGSVDPEGIRERKEAPK